METPTSNPKRIGLCYDHPLQVGGVENYLLTLMRRADPRQFQFTLFSQCEAPFTQQAAALGAQFCDWRRWQPADLGAPLALAGELRRRHIDLLHCHAPIAALWGRAAARLAGLPALVSVHLPMDQYHGSGQWPRARLGRWFYTRLDAALNRGLGTPLVFVSETIRRQQIARGLARANQTRVITTGVDLPGYQALPARAALRAQLNLPSAEVVLLCVGRLEPQKGQDVLLQAAARLAAGGLPFQLWLAGDGPQRAALESQAQAAGLNGQVTFLGARGDIPNLLGAADVFVLPSRYEAAPLALVEALAAGLPVIASRCGEIPAWIQAPSQGILLEPQDIEGLTAALAELISQPARRAQLAAAARTLRAQFSDESMTDAYYSLYRELLSKRA